MKRISNFTVFLALALLAAYYAGPDALSAGGFSAGKARDGRGDALLAQGGDDSDNATSKTPPRYTEVELTSLDGEIFINPLYTGKVSTVRTIDKNGLIGQKVDIEVRIMTDGWRKFSLPGTAAGAYGVIVSGDEGILKISKPAETPAPSGGELKSIKKLVIEFGYLSTVFSFPSMNILEPSKVELGVLNNADNKFINGSIVAMKPDQAAVEFQDLPATVVNKEGTMRVSLKEPGGTFINSDIQAWGYNIIVSETDIDTPAPITAEVFGLPDDAEIRFDFSSLTGQVIDPSTKILTVGEINKGATVSTITTKIGGAQPLTVTVRRVR
ncbi:MAG: hypothetical protein AB1598_09280 [Thermodesulfobacteriota bacterium]